MCLRDGLLSTQGEAVALHIYLDDVSSCGGPTVFVPADTSASCGDAAYALRAMAMMPGVAGHPMYKSRQRAEEYFSSAASLADAASLRRSLYARESGVQFEQGTIALYHHVAQRHTSHRCAPPSVSPFQVIGLRLWQLKYANPMQPPEDCTSDLVVGLCAGTSACCSHDRVSQCSGRLDPMPRRRGMAATTHSGELSCA